MARKISVEIVGDASSLSRAFSSASKDAKTFGSKFGAAAKTVGIAVAAAGAAAGAAAVALGVAGVKAASEYEKSMRNVNSIAGLSEKQFKSLGKAVLQMAQQSGQAPKVLADGLYDIVSSGFKANDALKVLRASSIAATAGMTTTETASKAVTAALNAYGLGAGEARRVSDVLFQTVNKGVLTFEELAQNMGDLVPAAAPLGVSLEEVGAAIATITLQGVPAAEAATRVKNTMLALAKPSKELSGLLKEQGYESGEAAIKHLGYAGVLQMLDKATKGSVTETAKLTPEIRALMGVVGLTGKNLKTYQENLDAMSDAQKGAGITAKVFEEQSKSLAVKMQKLSAGFDVLKIQLGTALAPALSSIVDHMNRFLAKFNEAEGAKAKFKVVIDEIKGLADSAWNALKNAVQQIDWSKVWDRVRDGLGDAGTVASDIFKSLKSAFGRIDWGAVWGEAKRIKEGLDTRLASIDWSSVGETIGKRISETIKFGADLAKKMAEEISKTVDQIDWESLGRKIGPGLAAAVASAFVTLTDPVFWARNWDLALAIGLVAFGGSIGRVGGKLTAITVKAFGKWIDDVVLWFANAFGNKMGPAIVDGFLVVERVVVRAITGLGSKLGSLISTLFGKLGKLATFTIKVLGVQAAINVISDFVSDMAGELASAAKVAYNKAKDIGRQVMDGIRSGAQTAWGKVSGFLSSIPGKIKGWFAGAGTWLYNAGVAILQGLWDGLKAKWDAVAGWLGGLGGKIAGLKGPESKDAVLLEPHGKAIIEGLGRGMAAAWGNLAPVIAGLGGKLVENYIRGVDDKAPEFKGKMAEAAADAVEEARKAVEKKQEVFVGAFDKLGEYAGRAFEGQTGKLLDAIDRKFEAKMAKWRALGDALTPAEQALADIAAKESERTRQAEKSAAQNELLLAKQAWAATTSGAEQEAAWQRLITAQERYRVAELAITTAALEEKAKTERQKRDEMVDAQIKSLEEARDREKTNLEERRRQLAEQLDKQLEVLRDKLAKHPEEYDKIQKQIVRLLKSYGADMKTAGRNLGEAFADGLDNAAKSVERSAKNLAAIVAKYLKTSSPTEKGPMSDLDSWWDGFAPALLSGLNTRMIESALAGVDPRVGLTGQLAPSATAAGGSPVGLVVNLNGPFYGDERGVRDLTQRIRRELQRVEARN